MRFHSSPHRRAAALACALALVLAVGPASAQAPDEPVDVGPTPPEINDPTGDGTDDDDVGPTRADTGDAPPGSDGVEPEPSVGEDAETWSAPDTDRGAPADAPLADVREVQLARTGYPALVVISVGAAASLLSGLWLLWRSRA
jgi:hypothetical protein